jgi:hypothetical protein
VAQAAVTPFSSSRAGDFSQPARDIGQLASALDNAAGASAALVKARKDEADLIRVEANKLRLSNELSALKRAHMKSFSEMEGYAALGLTDRTMEALDEEISSVMSTFDPADDMEALALRAVTQGYRNEVADYASRYEIQQTTAARDAEEAALLGTRTTDAALYATETDKLDNWLDGSRAIAMSVGQRKNMSGEEVSALAEATFTAGVASAMDRLIAIEDEVGASELLERYTDEMTPDVVSEYTAKLGKVAKAKAADAIALKIRSGEAKLMTDTGEATDLLVGAVFRTESRKVFNLPPGVPVEEFIDAMSEKEAEAAATVTSSSGAVGISQIMPATMAAPGYNVTPYAYAEGIPPGTSWRDVLKEQARFGQDYLNAMLLEFDGDLEKGVTAYHSGAANVAAGNLGPNGRDYATLVMKQVGELDPDGDNFDDILEAAEDDPELAMEVSDRLVRMKNVDAALGKERDEALLQEGVQMIMTTKAADLATMASSDATRAELVEKFGKFAPQLLRMIDNQQKKVTDKDILAAEIRWSNTPASQQTLQAAWDTALNTSQFLRFQTMVNATKTQRAEIAAEAETLDVNAVKAQVDGLLTSALPLGDKDGVDPATRALEENRVISAIITEQVGRGVAYTQAEVMERVQFHMAGGVTFVNATDPEFDVFTADRASYDYKGLVTATQKMSADEVYKTYFRDADPKDLVMELPGGRRIHVDPSDVFQLTSRLARHPTSNKGPVLLQAMLAFYRSR